MKYIILLIFLLFTIYTSAQDSLNARRIVVELTSEKYHGRGYVKKGDVKAAKFIRKEFRKHKLTSAADNYFQHFNFPVNTFPKVTDVKINNHKLIPGEDFIISPSCPSVAGDFKIISLKQFLTDSSIAEKESSFLLIDTLPEDAADKAARLKFLMGNPYTFKGILRIEKKLTWSVSTIQSKLPVITILEDRLPKDAIVISLKIKSRFIKIHRAVNVTGMIEGVNPDSFIFITAHYDHLGKMGRNAYFPGANDNASGTALMLDLASYFSRNKPEFSLVFIAFAGEEAGLKGSEYYTEHPVLPLHKIKFLINLDLLGNGSEGIMVVNGEIHPEEFSRLDSINKVHNYFIKVGKRVKAANSDHYPFSEKGVPAFFLYTMGGSQFYHDVYDRAWSIPFSHYNQSFRLITDFISTF